MSKVMKGLLRRRTLFATLLALTVFGAVYGFAATLSVDSVKLSAGNAVVASCQTTAPNSTYAVAYNAGIGTSGGYAVSSVTVTGLASACANDAVAVTLTGSGNSSLASLTGTVPTGGGSLTLTPSTTVDASQVSGVSVAISG